MRRMPRVASLVLMPHVGDHRLRALGLDPQRRDQRVFGIDRDAIGVSSQPEPDGEMHRHLLDPIPWPKAASSSRSAQNPPLAAPNVPKIGGPPQALTRGLPPKFKPGE